MRRTDRDIRHRVVDLMRSACVPVLLAWALTAVVSCGGSGGDDIGTPEVPNPTPDPTPGPVPGPTETGVPILFDAGHQEDSTVTRANSDTPLETYVKSFKVYGFKTTSADALQTVFPGYIVNFVENSANTSTTNTDGWEYVNQQPLGQEEQTIKYWDMSAKAYRFFGVAGATRTNEVTGEEETVGGVRRYKVTYTADAYAENETPYYSHLWYSDNPESTYGQAVQLQFIKPLSKVRFMFTFEDPTKARETTLTSKSFRPYDGTTIKMRGNVTVSYPLSGTDITESFSANGEAEGLTALTIDYYESVTKNEEDVVISPYYKAEKTPLSKVYTVLPAAGQGAYTLTVSINGEPKSAVVPAQFMNWLPGYFYTYIFKIHVDGSVTIDNVQSAFTPWNDHTATYTVHNW